MTNLYGDITQHIEYVPFGEVFLEERNNKWNSPYLFNGKELDEETGLSYYGARYYGARVSNWLSVDDPLINGRYLEKKHDGGVLNSFNLGAYTYCRNNPVIYIDPDGNQYVTRTISYNSNGTVKGITDRLYYTDRKARQATRQESRRGSANISTLSHGPKGPGILYVHSYADGTSIENMTFNGLGNHGIYSGAGSITKYGVDGQDYDFSLQPVDIVDSIAKEHDMSHAKYGTGLGFVEDTNTLGADYTMIEKVNRAINGESASELGVETPFNKYRTASTRRMLKGQRFTIGTLANYKQWKVDNMVDGTILDSSTYEAYKEHAGYIKARLIKKLESDRVGE